MTRFWYLVLLSLCSVSCARDIVFRSKAAFATSSQDVLLSPDKAEDVLYEDHKFAGLSTFSNLPYVHCISTDEDIESYDIAFLGAPFDTGTTARPGARYGPRGIRAGSTRILPDFAWNIYTENNTFTQWAKVVDCGDAPLTFLDNTLALKQLGKSHQVSALFESVDLYF